MLGYKVLLFLACQLALTHVITCSNDLLSRSTNGLGFKLYNALAKSGKDNIFISPLSIDYALAAVALGVDSKSYKQLATAMNLPTDEGSVVLAFKDDAKSLENDKNIKVATKLFIDDKFKVKESYKNKLIEVFNSTVGNVDFKDAEKSTNTINKWVEHETDNKITDLINKGGLLPETVAVLVNAVYFKSAWAHPFDPDYTKERTFHGLDGEIKVQMMEIQQTFGYRHDSYYNAHLVLLPYEGVYSMLLVVPDKKDGIVDLDKKISSYSFIDSFMNNKQETKIQLNMPKFTLEVTTALKDVLKEIGVNSIFTSGAFTEMSDDNNLVISSIVQKTYINVDEKSTEAAAATEVDHSNSMPIQVNADHPFMFAILHRSSEVVLFMGRYMNNK